jgi:hypothetical protein
MIRVGTIQQFDRLPPAPKFIALLVVMAGRDLATSVRIDCYPETRMDAWYFVGGMAYQLVPPPCSMWPNMIRELHRQTTFAPPDRRPWWQRIRRPGDFPQAPTGGHLALRLGDVVANPGVLLFRGRTGEHVEVETTDPQLRAGSNWFFGEWNRLRRELLVEFSENELRG